MSHSHTNHGHLPTEQRMSGTDHTGSHDLGHIVPKKTYLHILLILIFLTVVTVGVSRIDFGDWNIVVALGVASIKAGLVALFFMHLKYENPILWLYVALPVILIAIMIGGISFDGPFRIIPVPFGGNETHFVPPAPAPDPVEH